MDWSGAPNVQSLACGPIHTLILMKNGRVYSCGNNDHGQLGHELPRKRPRMSKFRMCFVSSTVFLYKRYLLLLFFFVLFAIWILGNNKKSTIKIYFKMHVQVLASRLKIRIIICQLFFVYIETHFRLILIIYIKIRKD